MNSFCEHQRDSIYWHYRRLDRILLNGLVQPFQQPERAVGFFNTYCQLYPLDTTSENSKSANQSFTRNAWPHSLSSPANPELLAVKS